MTKAERLRIFIERLMAAPKVATPEEAFDLMASTLNAVEDELTGIPFAPDQWRSDGRMYPPQSDAERDIPELPGWRRYRNKGHNTLIGPMGQIEINDLDGNCLIRKSGLNEPEVGYNG